MTERNWQRQYLGALLTSRSDQIAKFETVDFIHSVIDEAPNGVTELLLHRTIAQLRNVNDAILLIQLICDSIWSSYASRVLARIADPDEVLFQHPEIKSTFGKLRELKKHAPYSQKDWWLIGDESKLDSKGASSWTVRVTSIRELLHDTNLTKITIDDLAMVVEYFFQSEFRLYAIGILTLSNENEPWADTLHRVLFAPRIDVTEIESSQTEVLAERAPTAHWAPWWQISLCSSGVTGWNIHEHHTDQALQGLGAKKLFSVAGILLALSGLLRDGHALSPLGSSLTRPTTRSHFIWDFRPGQFSATEAGYGADDIRAIALAFLEKLPSTSRVAVFRSRLAIHFIVRGWKTRRSASMVASEQGFYQDVVRAARLLDQNRFKDVIHELENSPYQFEPAVQLIYNEATAALDLLELIQGLPPKTLSTKKHTGRIASVTHASLPDQTGGYAIRAQGVLASLRNQGIDITAVTRPGFPDGPLTEETSVEVDGVEYLRLSDTGIPRSQGEIQHMMSFVRPFREQFVQLGVSIVHVRSTFLVALPALIAARQLKLKVLYEVSGLWELVYQDRERDGQLLKRAPFAELAETLTMRRADQVVVMNEAVRRIAIDRGVDPARISVAHNAVDVQRFTPLQTPDNQFFTIGFLGSFQDYEGLEEIVHAVQVLKQAEISVRVILVGDGLRFKAIKSLIAKEGLEHLFELTGRVPHEQVVQYYKRMDVLVYPRRSTGATESITPLKPFEALALAKPIIVSDVAPLREIVGQNEERGLIFESGNAIDLAQAIQTLLRNPELRSALGKTGREWVATYRNWDNVVQTFIDAYAQLGYVTT